MDNTPPTTPPKSNRWARLGRKILISAIIAFAVNTFLKLTGWEDFEKFEEDANEFAETMVAGAARLTPLSLWNSITGREYNYSIERNGYFYERRNTSKVTVGEKISRWLGYYWYTDSGKAFWVGRILLVLAVVFGFAAAHEDYQKARDKTTAALLFPFNVVLKGIIFLLLVGLIAALFYMLIKLFIALKYVIAFIVTSLYGGGEFVRTVVDEAKDEAKGEAKKRVGAFILPFLFKRKQ
jgi:hypothetical protein